MYKKDLNIFFNAISAECNYIDKSVVKDVYFGMVRAIIKLLRDKGAARLPDFLDVSIEDYPEKNMINKHTGLLVRSQATKRVKFKSEYKFRQYFKQ